VVIILCGARQPSNNQYSFTVTSLLAEDPFGSSLGGDAI
jgi:hypothetical protein